ncbi:hypothetical protein O7626_39465 [Micromonospora sp. WMMD1102]|uniref:hypothetical protein n=1 Tax=Micromonospora sp. WMMD1102 TaxID=3016105 RepID=UPI00241557FB|nr:hypothetical protein [Micromonospora sp. WMMD1102]MDG4791895.1 hypothetical protein [Micromonospora sp. WMMD1102]
MTSAPPPMPDVPVGTVAGIDQIRAELTALVQAAREHTDAQACESPQACAGEAVADVLEEFSVGELAALLFFAVAELAATGYGRPDRGDLTVLAGLDWHHEPDPDDDGGPSR